MASPPRNLTFPPFPPVISRLVVAYGRAVRLPAAEKKSCDFVIEKNVMGKEAAQEWLKSCVNAAQEVEADTPPRCALVRFSRPQIRRRRTCTLSMNVDYNSQVTAPGRLAAALNQLLAAAMSTPGVLDERGNLDAGSFWVETPATRRNKGPNPYRISSLSYLTKSDI